MNRAIDWLILKGTKIQKLDVGAGNEQVFDYINTSILTSKHGITEN